MFQSIFPESPKVVRFTHQELLWKKCIKIMGCMSWNGEKKHLLRFSSAHQIKLVSSKKDTLRFTRETSMSFISELAQPTGTLGLVGFKNKLQVNNAHYHVHGCNRVPSSIINTPFTTLCVDSYYVVVIRFLLNFSKLFHNLWKGAQLSSIDLPIQQLRS